MKIQFDIITIFEAALVVAAFFSFSLLSDWVAGLI